MCQQMPAIYVSGRLPGIASLVSERIAMIESGLGFQLALEHSSASL